MPSSTPSKQPSPRQNDGDGTQPCSKQAAPSRDDQTPRWRKGRSRGRSRRCAAEQSNVSPCLHCRPRCCRALAAQQSPKIPIHTPMMQSLQYQVVVVRRGQNFCAHLFDLSCEAGGATAAEAVANIYKQARHILKGYEGTSYDPPPPSDITVTSVELPIPGTQQRPDDASAAEDKRRYPRRNSVLTCKALPNQVRALHHASREGPHSD